MVKIVYKTIVKDALAFILHANYLRCKIGRVYTVITKICMSIRLSD
jgi:hypothetical protein